MTIAIMLFQLCAFVDPFSYPCTRSFDAQKDAHPFKFVVENLQPSLLDPLSTWLREATESDDYVPDWATLSLMPVSRINLKPIRVEAMLSMYHNLDSACTALLCISFIDRSSTQ